MTSADPRGAHALLRERGFLLMLLLLTALAVLTAYGQAHGLESVPLTNVLLGAAIVVGVFAAEAGPRRRRIAVGGALLIVAWQAVTSVGDSEAVRRSHGIPSVALILFALVVVLGHVFRTERVTPDKIFGAICGYMLLAYFWSIVYVALAVGIGEGAFRFAGATPPQGELSAELVYYSWVTLSTLGYGDITPAHPLTRVAAGFECLVGQFYLAVVVARLVALQITQAPGGRD